MQKEKEYLRPLPDKHLLDTYIESDHTCVVSSTLLVTFKRIRYFVPAKYSNKRVKIIKDNTSLYIYYYTELIRSYEISIKIINYTLGDYKDGLMKVIKSNKVSIGDIAKDIIKLLGENNNE